MVGRILKHSRFAGLPPPQFELGTRIHLPVSKLARTDLNAGTGFVALRPTMHDSN